MRFGPKRVIYVSCNVHTQARDVGVLVKDGGFKIESVLPADLFPQTYHVGSLVCMHAKLTRSTGRECLYIEEGRGSEGSKRCAS